MFGIGEKKKEEKNEDEKIIPEAEIVKEEKADKLEEENSAEIKDKPKPEPVIGSNERETSIAELTEKFSKDMAEVMDDRRKALEMISQMDKDIEVKNAKKIDLQNEEKNIEDEIAQLNIEKNKLKVVVDQVGEPESDKNKESDKITESDAEKLIKPENYINKSE